MKIGILGTGMVGHTIATKLVKNGHQVLMGSRSATNEKGVKWSSEIGALGSNGSFEDAAKFGDIIFNCTSGSFSIRVFESAGIDNFKDKIVIDLSNPLDMSKADWEKGIPPTLLKEYSNHTSLGEEIQKIIPEAYVVKTLNTLTHTLMVDGNALGEETDLFISGNSPSAKESVQRFIEENFGWKSFVDLGGIRSARGVEQMLPIWLSLYLKKGHANFNFKIIST